VQTSKALYLLKKAEKDFISLGEFDMSEAIKIAHDALLKSHKSFIEGESVKHKSQSVKQRSGDHLIGIAGALKQVR